VTADLVPWLLLAGVLLVIGVVVVVAHRRHP